VLISTIGLRNERWVEDALCTQVDPILFYPDQSESAEPAKRVCALCPVKRECGSYALAADELYGVWGGMSEMDRRSWRINNDRVTRLPRASRGVA
jgi:WhiB family redox-sensing transcriptional regulator